MCKIKCRQSKNNIDKKQDASIGCTMVQRREYVYGSFGPFNSIIIIIADQFYYIFFFVRSLYSVGCGDVFLKYRQWLAFVQYYFYYIFVHYFVLIFLRYRYTRYACFQLFTKQDLRIINIYYQFCITFIIKLELIVLFCFSNPINFDILLCFICTSYKLQL